MLKKKGEERPFDLPEKIKISSWHGGKWKWKVKVKSLSSAQLFATPQIVAHGIF